MDNNTFCGAAGDRHARGRTGFREGRIRAADAFEQSLATAGTVEQSKIGSTASFAPHIKEGMIVVRRLDLIVKMKYGNDAATMAAWTFAKHVERAPQSPKPPSPPKP